MTWYTSKKIRWRKYVHSCNDQASKIRNKRSVINNSRYIGRGDDKGEASSVNHFLHQLQARQVLINHRAYMCLVYYIDAKMHGSLESIIVRWHWWIEIKEARFLDHLVYVSPDMDMNRTQKRDVGGIGMRLLASYFTISFPTKLKWHHCIYIHPEIAMKTF